MARRLLVSSGVALVALAAAPLSAATPPQVAIQATVLAGGAPLRVTFTAVGDPAAHAWDFGDGTTAAGPVVEHTFERPGAYEVRVTATAASGEASSAATAVTAYGLSLRGPRSAPYGRRVVFRGRIVPPLPAGELVTLRRAGAEIGRASVGEDGSFRIPRPLTGPGPYEVEWAGVRSRGITVNVRPLLHVAVRGRRVVGAPLVLSLDLRPRSAGELRVRMAGHSRPVVRRAAAPTRIRLRTDAFARFDLRISVVPQAGYLPATRRLRVRLRLPALRLGSAGPAVRVVERRLASLRYALRGVDGRFGYDTYEAILAVQKAHGLPRTGRMDASTWRFVRDGRTPLPRYFSGTHIEVDKGRQLLFDVRRGRLVRVVHASTGATGNTPLGRWRIYRKVPGWDWVLWYPMYFLRGFAVHGYPSVPAWPASHGCVRVPMWLAPSLYSGHPYGSAVIVY